MIKLYIDFSKTRDFPEADYYFKLVLRRAVLATLLHEGIDGNVSVSITLTDNEYIHKLNKKFRKADRHTDVLSFPMYERDEILSREYGDELELGDIVLSLERAHEQAREIGNTFLEEVAFLTVHSTLHLLGYDHERSREDDEEQCRLQKTIVSTLEI